VPRRVIGRREDGLSTGLVDATLGTGCPVESTVRIEIADDADVT
jgi:hypothetical protein